MRADSLLRLPGPDRIYQAALDLAGIALQRPGKFFATPLVRNQDCGGVDSPGCIHQLAPKTWRNVVKRAINLGFRAGRDENRGASCRDLCHLVVDFL